MKTNLKNSNTKPLFPLKEQEAVINNNQGLLDMMKQASSVKEWNLMREKITKEFKGSDKEMMMLFGYIDGVLFQKVFKK